MKRLATGVVVVSLALAGTLHATDGTFRPNESSPADPSKNLYGDTTKWDGGIVAGGVGSLLSLYSARYPWNNPPSTAATVGSDVTVGSVKSLGTGGVSFTGGSFVIDAGTGKRAFIEGQHGVFDNTYGVVTFGEPVEVRSPLEIVGSSPVRFSGAVEFREPVSVFTDSRFQIDPANPTDVTFSRGLSGQGSFTVCQDPARTVTVTNGESMVSRLALHKGTLRTVFPKDAMDDPSVSASIPQDGLLLHVDAAIAESIEFFEGTTSVKAWRDADGRTGKLVAGTDNGQVYPEFRPNALGGKPVVNFATGKSRSNWHYSAAYMGFDPFITKAKAVVLVIGSQAGGGHLFGPGANYCRGKHPLSSYTYAGTSAQDPIFSESSELTASVWRNGRAISPKEEGLTGGWDVLTISGANTLPDLRTFGCNFTDQCGWAWNGVLGRLQVAEALFYDHELSESERKAIEKTLCLKWKVGSGELPSVYARDRGRLEVACEDADRVPAIEELTGCGDLTVAAEGKVRLDNAKEFPGTLELESGTLVVGATADRLPSSRVTPTLVTDGLVARFDASEEATLDIEDGGRVLNWRSTVGNYVASSTWFDESHSWANGIVAPRLRPAAANGRPYVDLGVVGTKSFLRLNEAVRGKTLFLTGNARFGGGYVFYCDASQTPSGSIAFAPRSEMQATAYESQRFYFDVDAGLNIATWKEDFLRIRLNGQYRDPMMDGMTGGDDLVSWDAYKFPSSISDFAIGSFGELYSDWDNARFNSYCGGMQFGEVLVYDRELTILEIQQVEAYLRDRWIAADRPDVKSLRATGAARIETPSDAHVGALGGTSTLVKTGGGTLTVDTVERGFAGIEVIEGCVKFRNRGTAAAETLPVADPSFWLDADDATTRTVENGVVTAIAEKSSAAVTLTPGANFTGPVLAEEVVLNGRAVLDFGGMWSQKDLETPTDVSARGRTFFAVVSTEDQYSLHGLFLDRNKPERFSRSYSVASNPLFDSSADAGLRLGDVWRDGVPVNPTRAGFKHGYQIITLMAAADEEFTSLARSRFGDGGGAKFAEIIAYDRLLSDEERQQVEAYLSRKWFNEPLHGFSVPGKSASSGVTVAGTVPFAIPEGKGEEIGWIVGEGTVLKTGAGRLDIAGNIAGLGGCLDVSEGTVRLTASQPSDKMPVTAGLVADFDASVKSSLTFDGNGGIDEWRDRTGGYRAVPIEFVADPELQTEDYKVKPTYVESEPETNGRGIVDMGPMYIASNDKVNPPLQSGWGAGMQFVDDQGSPTSVAGVCSVFWIFGSQNNGGYLLGQEGGANAWSWSRGNEEADGLHALYQRAAAMFEPTGYAGLGTTYVDGRLLSDASGRDALNGGYQLIENSTWHGTAAEPGGFAYWRRTYANWADWRHATWRMGGQRLGEVVMFNRVLKSDEQSAMRDFMNAKWFGRTPDRSYSAGRVMKTGDVVVRDGATLDTNGHVLSVDRLATSGGSIVGDVQLHAVCCHPGETLAVDGTLEIGADLEWSVQEGAELSRGEKYKLIEFASVTGVENLVGREWMFQPSAGAAFKVRLRIVGNALYAVCGGAGISIIIR